LTHEIQDPTLGQVNLRNVSSLAMKMKNLGFGSGMIRIERSSEAGT